MSIPGVQRHGSSIGFSFRWGYAQPPLAIALQEDLIQLIAAEFACKTSGLVPDVYLLRTGLLLPIFWMVVKTSDVLKRSTYNWWRLDECSKHLLASWILSQDEPKSILGTYPILWEIYPTIVLGSIVQARIEQRQECFYFSSTAPPRQYQLQAWNVSMDTGICSLLSDTGQFLVRFTTAETCDNNFIQLLS